MTKLPEETENRRLGQALAKALGEGWRFESAYPAWITLRHGEDDAAAPVGHCKGRGLHVSTQDRDQYRVSLLWPYGEDNTEYKSASDQTVGVGKSRGVEVLAKEIQRRLLKSYFADYAEQLAKAKASLDCGIARRKLFAELLAIVGDKPTPMSERSCQGIVYKHGVRSITLSHYGTEVNMELTSLPVDVASDLLHFLANRLPK